MIGQDDIAFFLHLGYFPSYKPRHALDFKHDGSFCVQASEDELIQNAAAFLRKSVADLMPDAQCLHAVPLSGGIDSRAILAVLLEHMSAENISTYTFGTPGTWDFDIGCMIAGRLGTRHTAIDLSAVHWTPEELTKTALAQDAQTYLFHHVPHDMLQQFKDHTIWSGYLGDLVTGGHLSAEPSQSPAEARVKYVRKRAVSRFFMHDEARLASFSEQLDILPTGVQDFDEQVMFSEVGRITAPHVLPHGYTYRTPLINSPFMDFFLSLPREYRSGQRLFIRMLRDTWPALFSLPVKTNYGLSFGASKVRVLRNRGYNLCLRRLRSLFPFMGWPVHPATNYFDYDRALRTNPSLCEAVYSLLERVQDIVQDLSIQPLSLMRLHINGKGNYGNEILMLASLAVNLETCCGSNADSAPLEPFPETAKNVKSGYSGA